MKKYSVIIACHNEQASIARVIDGVKQFVPDAEIIAVDDGSQDGTAGVLARLEGIRTVTLPVNGGKGVALRKGIEQARGDVLVFIDGDGQDDPADLQRMIQENEKGHRFVNGSKFIGAIEDGGISRPNYWGNRFMSGLINLFFGSTVTDSQSGFRVIDKQVVSPWRITATQYEIETEMLCKALKAKVEIFEVPVTRKARTGGRTGFRRVRNGMRILFTILRERLT